MHGLGDRVDEAGVGVGREVDDDRGAGRDSAGDLNVEHHLDVGFSARRVAPAIDALRRHAWHLNAQLGEVGREVARAISATELDDCDCLSRTVDFGRESVRLGDLERCVGGADAGFRQLP